MTLDNLQAVLLDYCSPIFLDYCTSRLGYRSQNIYSMLRLAFTISRRSINYIKHNLHGRNERYGENCQLQTVYLLSYSFGILLPFEDNNPEFCAKNVQMGHHMQNQRAAAWHQ